MRVVILAAMLCMVSACRFDTGALNSWSPDSGGSDASADVNLPEAGHGDRIPGDTAKEAGQSDAGSEAGQDDAGQSDAFVQDDAEPQSDAQVQTDSGVQTDGPPQDPCVGLVADYNSVLGYVDHCTDTAGHILSLSGGRVYAPAGICRVVCWTQPSENASLLPDSCSGTWDVLVGGPSNWTSSGCVNVIPGAQPYVHGCNSNRACEVPKYPP